MPRIRLIMDLPINKKHGATEGKVFETVGEERGRGSLYFFIGDAGERCGAYRHEIEILPEESPQPPTKIQMALAIQAPRGTTT